MSTTSYYETGDFPVYLPKLKSLYDDLFSGGKGFRGRLIQNIGEQLNLKSFEIHLLSQTIEFIHNASLLHDDLLDRSSLRRNKTTAWLKYTPEYAVLAGDHLLARVMVNLSRYGNLALVQFTAETITQLLEGEWIQDSLTQEWNINLSCLDQVHYLKTASLFKWCFKAPFLCGKKREPEVFEILNEIGGVIGLLFQRSDDLLDFNVRNFENKSVLGDLKSGYLNSFGVFLFSQLSRKKKKLFRKCKTIEDVESVIGQKNFEYALKEFDKKNQKFIDLYHHYVSLLEEHLKGSEKQMISQFHCFPDWLYWRRKP